MQEALPGDLDCTRLRESSRRSPYEAALLLGDPGQYSYLWSNQPSPEQLYLPTTPQRSSPPAKLMTRPSSAPQLQLTGRGSAGKHPTSQVSHPGALSWLYSEPASDGRRERRWIRSCSNSERKLRVVLKRPLANEMPSERKNGTDYRQRQLERMQVLLDKAGKILPPETPVLDSGQTRMERIRGLPLHVANDQTRNRQAPAEDMKSSTQVSPVGLPLDQT